MSRLLFSWRGRINRAKYWLVFILCSVVVVASRAVIKAVSLHAGSHAPDVDLLLSGAVLFTLMFIVTASTIKRLHDRGRSGWWSVLFWVMPNLMYFASAFTGDLGATVLQRLGGIILICGFVELGCLRGKGGANRYGPDPLAELEAQPSKAAAAAP